MLLGQAFEIMFKEFERYIGIMLGFDGIDWSTYVRKRNQDRYDKGDELAELRNEDNILLDEIEEEKEEEQKTAEEDPKPAEEDKPAEEEPKPAEESAQIEEKPIEELTEEEKEERRLKEE